MNGCHLDREALFDYLMGSWTPEQELAMENHLADCDQCAFLAQVTSQVMVLQAAAAASIDLTLPVPV